jgi:hypothetical protein
MNRKIILLNVVLVLVVAYGGTLLRRQILAGEAKLAQMHQAQITVTNSPVLAPLADRPPVMSNAYRAVVVNTLFHPSRNSELPPTPPLPSTPAPPMPSLPTYRGTMNLDGDSIAILALGNASSQAVKNGDSIGPFKLVDLNLVDITFEWEGAIVRRTLDQLADHSGSAMSSAGSADSGRSLSPPPSAAAPVIPQPLGPGPMTPQGVAICLPNDSTLFGTVQNGLRKVKIPTPFADACVWEPVTKGMGGRL